MEGYWGGMWWTQEAQEEATVVVWAKGVGRVVVG